MKEFISVRGAKEHNLKNIDVDIPRGEFVVITGLSGSGKSSLAFDTIYAEGQRRYVESLSSYARQFLELQDKPDVESITGLSPAIAIDQRTTSKNPRSTVATVTEIFDYLRLLFARIGVPYSPATGLPIEKQSVSQMVDKIMDLPEGTKIHLLAPVVVGKKGEFRRELVQLKKAGYTRIKIDDSIYDFDELPALDRNKKHDISVIVDRVVIADDLGNRLADSIETSLGLSSGLLHVEVIKLPDVTENVKNGDIIVLSEKFSCPVSGFQITEIEPRIFSFNSPYGACPACEGLGNEMFFDPELIVQNAELTLNEGAITPWANAQSKYYRQTLGGLAKHYGFSLDTPFSNFTDEIKKVILYGSGKTDIAVEYDDGFRVYVQKEPFDGVIPHIIRFWKETDSAKMREEFEKYQNITDCSTCGGHRLNKESLCIKLDNKNIGEVAALTVEEALEWIKTLPNALNKTQNQIAERVLLELTQRIGFLNDVGLDYLTLARKSATLSGGESQRIRLASQIGAGLSGVLYVLDEPSIGLHQCDNDKLLTTLKNLKNLGNTVIVVEHDEETIRSADHLVDIGIGAGVHGGRVIAQGTPEEVAMVKESITGQYLRGEKFIPIPKGRKIDKKRTIKIHGARTNNLKNISVDIPLRTFCSITGVSGGGKSSLIIHTLYNAVSKIFNRSKKTPGPYDYIEGLEYIDKIIQIDQSPIGRTPRSNPATYTGAFSPIRDLFVSIPESKARGYKSGRFSFNVKGGRCETCQGDGMLKIEMHFLPDVYVKCEACNGARYNRETLEIKYKGMSIADILGMTVDDAEQFFRKMPLIHDKFKSLKEVGLGYVRLGQSSTTLSGGEAQRIKLARELSKRSTGRTLYILDEPTTGLHTDDIKKLLSVLHKLVDTGNTVLVIEHNMDVIKTSDWIIDIGPGGGIKGGLVVAEGTPEDVANCKDSITGKYLKRLLQSKEIS